MTLLRKKMIGDMQLHHFTESTQKSYLIAVYGLAKYYRMSPDKLSEDKLKDYILYLVIFYALIVRAVLGFSAPVLFCVIANL